MWLPECRVVCEAVLDLGFPTLVWLPECKAVCEAVVDLGFPTLVWLPECSAVCEAVVRTCCEMRRTCCEMWTNLVKDNKIGGETVQSYREIMEALHYGPRIRYLGESCKGEGCGCKREGCDYFLQSSFWTYGLPRSGVDTHIYQCAWCARSSPQIF